MKTSKGIISIFFVFFTMLGMNSNEKKIYNNYLKSGHILHAAVTAHYYSLLELWLENSINKIKTINKLDLNKDTPLSLAVKNKDIRAQNILVSQGALLINSTEVKKQWVHKILYDNKTIEIILPQNNILELIEHKKILELIEKKQKKDNLK